MSAETISPETPVYTRDASWFNHPSTSSMVVKKFHLESPTHEGTARCAPGFLGGGSRVIPLITEWGVRRAGYLPPAMLCRRCFRTVEIE